MPTIAFLAPLTTAEHKRRWDLLNEHAGDGVNVVAVDPTLSPGELIEALEDADVAVPWLASVPLEIAEQLPKLKLIQLLTAGYDRADVVGLCLALTPSTGRIIGKAEFEAMKPTSLLVNGARGALIEEAALVEAMNAGTIGGAGLDSVGSEPLAEGSPFLNLPNSIITAHVRGVYV